MSYRNTREQTEELRENLRILVETAKAQREVTTLLRVQVHARVEQLKRERLNHDGFRGVDVVGH